LAISKLPKTGRYQQELQRQLEKERHRQTQVQNPFVYYCAWADRPDAIKIGYTTNVLSRMKSFLTGSPSDLWMIAIQPVKSIDDEARLHGRFRHHKIRGEWFHAKEDLLTHILSLDQNLAIECHLQFPAHYQSCIQVPSTSSFMEAIL